MSLTKPERRQRIRFKLENQLVVLLLIKTICFRNNEIYAQLIDDVNGVTLLAASSREKEIEEKVQT
jgi:large subunit ribosomal protein L18